MCDQRDTALLEMSHDPVEPGVIEEHALPLGILGNHANILPDFDGYRPLGEGRIESPDRPFGPPLSAKPLHRKGSSEVKMSRIGGPHSSGCLRLETEWGEVGIVDVDRKKLE